MANFQFAQLQEFSLAGSGAIIGATTITLKSMLDIDGNTITMAGAFGNIGFGTLSPGNGNLEEQISFTGLTNNANGTVTLTGVSSVTFLDPYTATSGLLKTHAGSTPFIISNTSGFYNKFPAKDNDETITGQWTFDVTPVTPPAVSDASTTVKGITKISAAPDSAGNPIAVGANVWVAYAVDSVGTDAYAITPTPAIASYTAGQVFTFKAGTANTGPATLNVNGLGAKTIYKRTNVDLVTGDILANQIVMVEYDGTNMQLISVPASGAVVDTYAGGGVFTVTIASPAVFSLTAHGFSIGTPVVFSTTGALPTGLTAGTTYYVISAGFTANAFQVSTSLGGSAVNTSGGQSGVHTAGFAWIKAAGAKMVQVIAVGGGGSGAGGQNGGAGGSGGGGGGGVAISWFDASLLSSTEYVFAGEGGVSVSGVNGVNGTQSSFGSKLTAGAGGGGIAGAGGSSKEGGGGGGAFFSASGLTGGVPTIAGDAIASQGPSGTAAIGRNAEYGGGSGGGGGGTTNGGSSIFAAGGGGCGGYENAGGAGGTCGTYTAGGGGAGGAAAAGVGTAGANNSTILKGYAGAGGGGGGGNTASGSGNGGNGGFPGGGGGGGGGRTFGAVSPASTGGNGGDGQVKVITYF